ncbi:MAG: chromate efflux transporter [Alphaproteobacteria bacterium]|nr:chromate efflux transporter [Alphaproteobacteria bacterium]MBU1551447.1 chromate efflux transporter [Alphaproteobacteria bacterium]MBU2334717.1 chromate efflux transporter [Alphaproteobacteria bacterium]MBU2386440.1 chromate efflux transporter [Alphaproteobacteria bacterium]
MTDLGKAAEHAEAEGDIVPLSQAVEVWARVAALSFGGPAGQIAVMHRILVDEKRWIGEHRFLHALNYCMLLPGPEAHQLAIYIGWLLNRTLGGMIAGLLFVLPGFFSILALSYIYVLFGNVSVVEGMFFGLKCAVLAVVIQAVFRIGSRALRNGPMIGLTAAAFIAIFFLHVPFPLIIIAAGVIGYVGGRSGATAFRIGGGHKAGAGNILEDRNSRLGEGIPPHAAPNLAWSLKTSGALAALWLLPVAGLLLALGEDNVFSQLGVFFSQMAVVTFGGAYAVLAYVAQEAVQGFGWLRPGEMLDGLGMAETTPGPLIMVTQFVGFLAGYREPGSINPLAAATLAAVLTTWVTFIPSFLWIFAGAPFMERMRDNAALSGAMAAITAAVVGVILNLAVWFGLHVLFREVTTLTLGPLLWDLPVLSSVNWPSLILTLLAAVALFALRQSVIAVLLASSLLGIAWQLLSATQ